MDDWRSRDVCYTRAHEHLYATMLQRLHACMSQIIVCRCCACAWCVSVCPQCLHEDSMCGKGNHCQVFTRELILLRKRRTKITKKKLCCIREIGMDAPRSTTPSLHRFPQMRTRQFLWGHLNWLQLETQKSAMIYYPVLTMNLQSPTAKRKSICF